MAWTEVAVGAGSGLTTGEINAAAADKPLFISGSIWKPNTARWMTRTTTTPTMDTAGDDAIAGYPAVRAFDGHAHSGTKATQTNGEYEHALLSGGTVNGPFDSLFMIIDPGRSANSSSIDVFVEIATDDQYSTGNTTIYSTTVSSGSGVQRFVSLDLNSGNYTYTGSGHIRIGIQADSATNFVADYEPTVYEVILGSRYQLSKKANRPFLPDSLGTVKATHKAESGAASNYVMRSGQWVGDFEWQLTTSGLYSIDDIATMQAFYADCDYGAESFVYIEDPTTAPELARLVRTDKTYEDMRYDGPFMRMFSLAMEELPPFAGR